MDETTTTQTTTQVSTLPPRRTRAQIVQDVYSFYKNGGRPGKNIGDKYCQYCVNDNLKQRCAYGCQLTPTTALFFGRVVDGTVMDIYEKDCRNHIEIGSHIIQAVRLYGDPEDKGLDLDAMEDTISAEVMNLLPSDCDDLEGVKFWAQLQVCHDTAADHPEEFLELFSLELKKSFNGEFGTADL